MLSRWATYVCIPNGGQSFVSKAIAKGPISIQEIDSGTAHIAGPPATCVNIALNHLAPGCDFVVSGPNVGHNAGRQAPVSPAISLLCHCADALAGLSQGGPDFACCISAPLQLPHHLNTLGDARGIGQPCKGGNLEAIGRKTVA